MSSNMRRAVRGTTHKSRANGLFNQTIHSRLNAVSNSTTRDKVVGPNGEMKESNASNATEPTALAAANQKYDPDISTIHSSTTWPHRSFEVSSRVVRAVRPLSDKIDADYGAGNGAHALGYQPQRKVLKMPSFLKTRDLSHSLSSHIVNNLGSDVHACPETPILLIGTSKELAVLFERSLRLAYSHNFSKAEKEAYRISILHDVVHSMRGLLLSMKDTGIPLHETNSNLHAFVILTNSSTTDWKYLPKEISNAVTMLWKDQGVNNAFNSLGLRRNWSDMRYFWDLMQRICQSDYEPTSEDTSRHTTWRGSSPNILIPRKIGGKRYNYRFIDATGTENGETQYVYTSDNVALVLQVVDIAAFDPASFGNSAPEGTPEDLRLFQRICSSRWLSDTPLLVLISGTGQLVSKLQYLPHRHQLVELGGDKPNIAEVKAHFRRMFLQADKKYNVRVWVDLIDINATADNGQMAVGIIDKMLTEASVLNYGTI